DPAIVISYKRNSLSIGPKVFLVNSGTIASGGNWRGLRANYQYTFINPSRKCNLLLFYEFSAIKYFNESSSGYGDHMVTRISFKNYINHEIGIGTRYKLLKSFYLNSSYAIGICLNKSYTTISGPLICTIPFDFPPYSVNRLTGFFRVGLQYDFNL
ncbi:MAG TPA: hypothetical protein VI757_16315, partial [Bacteroidia bacterium]|nr:hypothetical protein [Bacteroidia bacterium]